MTLTSIPGAIQQILTEDFVVYTQNNTLNQDSNAFIEFKVIINESRKLFRKAKFIELNFIDISESIFKNQFKKETEGNNFSKINESKRSYSSIQNEEDFILKDVTSNKDAYTNYQSTFNINENFNFIIDFNQNNYDSESKIYEILLGLEKSRNIINKAIPRSSQSLFSLPNSLRKINISILDKDKNIIDQTGFKNIDLSLSSLIRKVNTSDRLKFSKYYLDYFRKSIRLNYYNDAIEISYDSNSLDSLNIDRLDFDITYFSATSANATISKNKRKDSRSAIFNYNTAGFNNFTNKIVYDFLDNKNNFEFLISVKLLKAEAALEMSILNTVSVNQDLNLDLQSNTVFSNTINRDNLDFINNRRRSQNIIDKNQLSILNKSRQQQQKTQSITYSNSNYEIDSQKFILQRGSNFINAIRNISSSNIVNRCLGSVSSPKVTKSYEVEGNKIKLIYDFNQILSYFYDKIKIRSFYIDSIDVEYYFNNKSFSVENKVFYKGDTIKNLLNSNNQIVVYRNLTSNPINTSIDFEIVDFDSNRRINFDEIREIIEEVNYNNIINQTNFIFKNNTSFSNVILNTTIVPDRQNIFNYERIAISNIEYFQDFAYNYGYINEDSTPNVVDFLNNCVLHVENINTIEYNEESSFNVHSKFIFLRNIFDFENVSSDTVYSNVANQNLFLNGDDVNFIREINSESVKDFLTSASSLSNASKNLTKFDTLNIKNSLTLKVLPVPKIIFENFRNGIEIDRAYRNTRLIDYSRLESEEYAERLDKEIVKYFFNNNSSLNYNKFNRFVSVLYSDDIENDVTANSFVEMFQELTNANIEPKNFFKIENSYNKSEIIRSLNLNNENFSFLEENILETINNKKPKSDHFNLQMIDNVIHLFEDQMPFNYEILNYRLQGEEFLFKDIKITKNRSKKLQFDITNLKNIFSEIDFQTAIFDLTSNFTFHFLNSKKEGFIDSSEVDSNKYTIINLEGKNFLTYNLNYVDNYPSDFVYYNLDAECNILNVDNKLICEPDFNFSSMTSISYSTFREFFDYCILNEVDFLEKVFLRSTISFSFFYENEKYDVRLFNNSEIPRKNLLNEKVKINSIENIEKQIVNFI